MGTDHIVKSFDEDLKHIDQIILRMGGMTEAALAGAIEALQHRDADLAKAVVADDKAIDRLEQELEDLAVRVIALRQPMANDLRAAISALKISSDLERIGDYAKNIAKRSMALSQSQPIEAAGAIPRMAKLVQSIIKDTIDAYGSKDAERALDVWYRDQEVDEYYNALFRQLLTYMMEDPRNITPCTHLLFIAKNIERMGDHATNIAETIHYLATGKKLDTGRPKKDTTSFEVLKPDDEAMARETREKTE